MAYINGKEILFGAKVTITEGIDESEVEEIVSQRVSSMVSELDVLVGEGE